MKFKLGDFVRFVDEKREGYITRIIDEQMIGVTGDDDFEIPVLATKVTSVYGHQGAGQAKSESNDTAVPVAEFQTEGVYLGVVSDAKAASVVHFHLVNDTSFQLLAALTNNKGEVFKGEYAGILPSKTSVDIYSAQLADIQLWPQFELNVLFFTKQAIQPPAPLNIKERFKAKDFAGAKKVVPLINQQGWLIRLDEAELVIDAEKLKESFFKPAEEKQKIDKPTNEVDLHIEKLRQDYQFINTKDILGIQVEQFKKALDAAIVHQLPAITFIHGAGNGILRHELHKQLGKHPKVQTFMDAQKEKFGYGATKVLLK